MLHEIQFIFPSTGTFGFAQRIQMSWTPWSSTPVQSLMFNIRPDGSLTFNAIYQQFRPPSTIDLREEERLFVCQEHRDKTLIHFTRNFAGSS